MKETTTLESADVEQAWYTSSQAARISGVPFFTLDYWGRTRFVEPSLAKGQGRGKGRGRMYSYVDIIRLRVARELRDQKVSLETLRAIVRKLGKVGPDLARAQYALVTDVVEIAASFDALVALLDRPAGKTFGVLLDLRASLAEVHRRARAVKSKKTGRMAAAER